MKKIIKIFTLMLLIVMFFGITTSQAVLTVNNNTTADEMIEALDNSGGLTGISHLVRKNNAYLYCRQHGTSISKDATYIWANGTKENSMVVYPGTDANGYAKAYILAAPGYDKHNSTDKSNERQYAWWQILGQEEGKNNVYLAAEAYQKFKANEKEVTVETKDAKASISDTSIIYGPIKIEYSYVGGNGYSFGGFNYAFFNSNGENVSDKVQLCTLSGDTYTQITSTEGTDGYYNVRTDVYNKVELYAVTQDRTLQSVNMKIQSNSLECEATVYELQGYYKTGGHYNYCMDCHDWFEDALTSISDAYKAGALWEKTDGIYYKFSYENSTNSTTSMFNSYWYFDEEENKNFRAYRGSQGSWTTTGWSITVGSTTFSSNCSNSVEAITEIAEQNGIETFIKYTDEGLPICKICNYTFEDYRLVTIYNHLSDHMSKNGYYTITNYYFERYKGCGKNGCGMEVSGTDNCESQRLFLVDTTTSTEEIEITAEIKIPFVPAIKIELGKYNSYNATTYAELSDAEYTVQAIQNGTVIYSKAGAKSGEAIEIVPITYDNVYIKITETKAPNGYVMISTPINAVMSIDGAKTQWYPSFAPTEEAWGQSGFDSSTFGGWSWVDDGSTALPNDYKSKNGDFVNVSISYPNGGYAFKVAAYNEPIINKLELLKIDSVDQRVLVGTKFKATLSNVKTITINGEIISVTSDTEVDLETDANGKCLIEDIKLIDENENVVITITEVQVPASNTGDYYYKKLSEPIVITVTHTPTGLNVTCKYDGIENVSASQASNDKYSISLTVPNIRVIDLGGKVWLDGQTGIKPAVEPNGNIDASEQLLKGIVVKLYMEGSDEYIAETVTDSNGEYKFEGVLYGKAYEVRFEYDGINYEATITGGDSKADENETDRTNFNNKFTTINCKQAVGTNGEKTLLGYIYSVTDKKSTLNTGMNTNTGVRVHDNFKMISSTAEVSNGYMTLTKTTKDLNLGLVKRGTDLALSTDVYTAKVTINGQETDYNYDKGSLVIGPEQTSEEVTYNLNLYTSDYNYRIRDYVSNDDFTLEDFNDEDPVGVKTGSELEVYVTYELNLQNQSTETARINEVTYTYDTKYEYLGIAGNSYEAQESGNVLTINLNGLSLTEGETKTLYLVFRVTKVDDTLQIGDFYNYAEITSYSTDKGLIDCDSQPGNYAKSNQVEDDNDTVLMNIAPTTTIERKITGEVFDNDDNGKVNDVIVQLIEVKEYKGKFYEYIWQETVTGNKDTEGVEGLGEGKRINATGDALETYTYSRADGYYEFQGMIPGDYIVRFIYGDGTTYDMNGNVIKYNGQDYKSMVDSNYNAEWYNSSSYTVGASVARDNEARRLETMAYSVEIDAEKGLLLKLLDKTALNLTEKETLIAIYNEWNDSYSGLSDITYTDITEISDEIINAVSNLLLLKEVLPNTWMCAETSKIKVAVDTENITNTGTTITVNGITKNYVSEISNINLGLELRPVTKIELKKYITGFKLIALDGTTLVNAYIDVNEYLNGTTDISNKVQGIRDNVTILDTVWQYEVSPTDINTVVDGASLEFEYTLVVKNTSETDYLSTELANRYANSSVSEYKSYLASKASEVKATMRNGTYRTQIGNTIGNNYYVGGTGAEKVLTEVTNIRDYVNNDLTFVFSYEGKVDIDDNASKKHRILRDDYSMQEVTIDTVLKTTESTGKMSNTDSAIMYTVTLGKNPISSTGNLEFDTYIAEVMSYTNAAGRRAMTSTPGNAEIIDHEKRDGKTHEIDEADTGRIQIGVATGEDEATNYIIIIAVSVGLALVAVGAYVIKKYFMK